VRNGVGDSISLYEGVTVSTETHVDDMGTVVNGPPDARRNVDGGPGAAHGSIVDAHSPREHANGHELALPGHAGHTHPIVA